MDDFAELLRQLMAEQGLGVRALAGLVPCDPALISRPQAYPLRPPGELVPAARAYRAQVRQLTAQAVP